MSHEMIQTDAENGVWECASCPRKIVLTGDNYKVLEQGNFDVTHFGSTVPGLMLDSLTVEPGGS